MNKKTLLKILGCLPDNANISEISDESCKESSIHANIDKSEPCHKSRLASLEARVEEMERYCGLNEVKHATTKN